MVLPVVIIAFADCVNHFNNLIMANALTIQWQRQTPSHCACFYCQSSQKQAEFVKKFVKM
ncbi:hypothetical protein AO375_0983 [Moraxella catarrhalis]|nr:hypothetical protein AO375_0983 [Moraxella catarrhalis]